MAIKQALRLQVLRIAGKVKRPAALPREPRSILIIRPDHLGDLVLAAPALPAIKAAHPQAKLSAWLGPWGEPVWRQHPSLDAIEVCPFPGFTRAAKPNPLAPYRLAVEQARVLRGRFDLAINLRFDFWWGAMAASWAGIPVAGYDIAECQPFLAQAIPYHLGFHETDQNLRLVAAISGQPVSRPDSTPLFLDGRLPAGLPEGAIAIHPGAGAEVKLWDEEKWARLADALANDGPIVINAGSAEEVAMAERIRGLMRQPAGLAQGLSLPELAAFYRHCRLVVGADNGPVHIARSVGTPTVALFGPTNPGQFGPHPQDSVPHQVVRLPWRCIPCGRLDYNPIELTYHLCVRLIEPEMVLVAARRVLVTRTSSPS